MKKRVLIVEDSILMQRVIGDIIIGSGEFEILGYARNVEEGWAKFNKLKPDVITLDFELPGENGLALLSKIMASKPTPVLMLSAHTKSGAELTIKSLELGAVDFFTKPSGPISIDLYEYRDDLITKLRLVAAARLPRTEKAKRVGQFEKVGEYYLGIAASTGGVRALNYLVPSLPGKSRLRVIVVQHMPKFFTASLAQHLNERSSLVVREANDGDLLSAGEVLVAPGGHHIKIDTSGARVILSDEPPHHGVKPSADILFESMAKVLKNKAIGIILTGMGKDGAEGIRWIKEYGGRTIAQDPHEAVIASMPQSAIDTGCIDYILPLPTIAQKLMELIRDD